MHEVEGGCRMAEGSEGEGLFFGGEREERKTSAESPVALVNGRRTEKRSVELLVAL